MTNDYLDINIEIDNTRLAIGKIATGRIIVTAYKKISLDHFGFKLLLEQRGRLSVQQKKVFEQLISSNEHFQINETKVYEIQFEPTEPPSLSGVNFQLHWTIETFGKFKFETERTIRNDSLKKLKLFKAFSTEKFTKAVQGLTFYYEDPKFTILKVDEENLSFKNWPLIAGIAFIFLFILFDTKLYIFSIVIAVVVLFFLLYHFYSKSILENLKIKSQNLEDNKFQIKIILDKNSAQHKSIFTYFTVEEKVIDRRGTSSTTHNKVLYRSEDKRIKKFNNINEIIFNFPPSDIPASYILGDVEIIWIFHCVIESKLGFDFFYSNKMEVVKR